MSKINLTEKEWCDLVFEGRNKEYGAYRMRANSGRRQLRAVLWVLAGLLIIMGAVVAKNVASDLMKGDEELVDQSATEFSSLKKEEKKEEKKEKKIEQPKEQPKAQQVQVQNSIQLVVPKIVDDDKVTQKMETQKTLQTDTRQIGSISFDKGSDKGINIDELKQGQVASNITTPPVKGGGQATETKVVDNNLVEVPATFPGGEAALIKFVSQNTKYPEIDQEQGTQGTMILRFCVGADGSVSQVTVKKSLSRTLDAAAITAVKKLPRFTPAKSNGHPVPVWFTLPITFKIQ